MIARNLEPVVPKDGVTDLVEELRRVAGGQLSATWRLGYALGEVVERELWKLPVDAEGKPVYRSFKAFAAGIIGRPENAAVKYAYALMSVSREFDEETVDAIGYSKALLILRFPERRRAVLVAWVREGMTKGELEEELRRWKGAKESCSISLSPKRGQESKLEKLLADILRDARAGKFDRVVAVVEKALVIAKEERYACR